MGVPDDRTRNYELLFYWLHIYILCAMPIYSHSRLSTYEQCKLKYKYAYIDCIKMRKDHIEAFLGSRFHEVMEHLYAGLPMHVPTLDELTAKFNSNWDKEWHDKVIIHNKERTAEDYRAIGIRAINDYYKRYAPFDSGRVLGLERELLFHLDDTGKHQMRCIIDRLTRRDDNIFEIHDYKTSGFMPAQAELDNDRQLALYEMAVRKAWPDTAQVDLIWHYVQFDMEMRSTRTPAQLDDLRLKTIALINEVASIQEFPPHESNLCAWCDFQEICPLFAHKFKVEAMPLEKYSEEKGIWLVNRYAALESEKQLLAERIKQIENEEADLKTAAVSMAETEGIARIFGDTHILTLRDDISVSYPKKAELARADFEARLKILGLWEEIADVNWSSLKAMAKRQNWAEEGAMPSGLTEFVKVEKSKQVRLVKKKDVDD